MTFWPQLTQDFTPYVYKNNELIPIDPSQIVEEWEGREVDVILIGNKHNSGTLAKQTRQLIKTFINTTGVRDRAVSLAEGLALEGNHCGSHPLVPKQVAIMGADCRAKGTHRITKEYIRDLRALEKMIMEMNKKNYNELKDLAKSFNSTEEKKTFMVPSLAVFNELLEMFKRWSLEDNVINEAAKHLGSNPVEDPEELQDDESNYNEEIKKSNLYLSSLIISCHEKNQVVFAPWGIDHFIEDDSFYKRLIGRGVKPLVLLPKEENSCDYYIEFARWQEAVICDFVWKKFSCIVKEEDDCVEQEIPSWMAAMLSKVLRTCLKSLTA